MTLAFTGEYFVPGSTSERIADDHVARYRFASALVAGKAVCDVACGAGYGSQILLQCGAASYLGVDIKPELIDHARQEYGKSGAEYVVGDIERLRLSKQFDVIVCFETIEHVSDASLALCALRNALVPEGGILIISTPNRAVTSPGRRFGDRPLNRFHVREFLKEEMLTMLDASGFDVQKASCFGQRLRHKVFRNRVSRKIWEWRHGSSDNLGSAEVSECCDLHPKYLVFVVPTRPVAVTAAC